jgi:IS1 family transposase
MRDLQVNLIELDEQWDFIQKKQKRVQTGDPGAWGDVWLFIALASTQKAVLSYLVGKRSAENTRELVRCLVNKFTEVLAITVILVMPNTSRVEGSMCSC